MPGLEFNQIRNDSLTYLHNGTSFELNEVRDWYYREGIGDRYWSILWDEQIVGYFRTSEWDLDNKTVCVGADIAKDWRNKGLGQKVYVIFMDIIFSENDINKLWLEVLGNNYRAIHLYKKLGFLLKQNHEKSTVIKDGKEVESLFMYITKDRFYENRNCSPGS